ncbi:MAG: hypothetical protein SV775_09030 [Thermodesulfobacteriota bacterium]|nr:hypothetical protein [Thermodesulfobacteriota bacterium]
MEELGCRSIQFLPVNPAATTYGRMGRFGRIFVALRFGAVDLALAKFYPMATPTEEFVELVDAIHTEHGNENETRLLINQTVFYRLAVY